MDFKNNPFESGHIKNYILLYASIVVIMVLFFIAGELFMEDKEIEKKLFSTEVNNSKLEPNSSKEIQEEEFTPKFKLLDSAY